MNIFKKIKSKIDKSEKKKQENINTFNKNNAKQEKREEKKEEPKKEVKVPRYKSYEKLADIEYLKSINGKQEQYFKELLQDNDESNVNLITVGQQNRARDLYGFNTYNNNKSLQYILYLIAKESLPPVNIYEWHLEMLIKNEAVAQRILDLPIYKTFSRYHIVNNTHEWDIHTDVIKKYMEKIYMDVILAIKKSELFGGCYIVLKENRVYLFQPSQIKISKEEDKLMKFNKMLISRDWDKKWLKENNLEYVDFQQNGTNDLFRISYDKIVLFTSSKKPIGMFMESELKGIGLSVFEGNLHYLCMLTNAIQSMEEQITRQNMMIEKVKNFYASTQDSSLAEMSYLQKGVETLGSIRTADSIITDVENEIEMLKGDFNIKDTLEYGMLNICAIIYGVSVQWLTGEQTKNYVNTESVKTQNDITNIAGNIFERNYQKDINYLVYLLCKQNGIQKTHIVENTEHGYQEDTTLDITVDDFTIQFEGAENK